MISVVIVNYNGKEFLERCLSSLKNQTIPGYEVIVVDNASSDGSIGFITEHFQNCRLIKNATNLGFAGGANAGIRAASGEYIMTLNNDTWTEPDCLEQLLSVMESDESVGMCAAKMLFPDGRINSTGICISRSMSPWDRGMHEIDVGQYDRVGEVFGPCAGAALYRRSMLDEIGLFDEDFFLYIEDVDLAFRAQLAGWKCIYTHHAVVYHIHSGTAGFASHIVVYYGNRNALWCILKNYPVRLFILSLPWIIGRNAAAMVFHMLQGRGRIILKAKLDALKGAAAMLEKRRFIQQNVLDRDIMRFVSTWSKIGRINYHVASPV